MLPVLTVTIRLQKKLPITNPAMDFRTVPAGMDCISQDGVLWISTEDSKLLYRVDPFHKSIYSIPTVNQALSFLEDKEGYLWVGTWWKWATQI